MSLAFYLTVILNGVLTGLVYGLAALGFAVIFSTVRIVNIAHGGMMVAGMTAAMLLATPRNAEALHVDPLLGVPIVAAALFVCGFGLHSLLIAPLSRAPASGTSEMPEARRLLLLAGVAVMVTGALIMILGTNSRLNGVRPSVATAAAATDALAYGAVEIDRLRLRAALLAAMGIGVLFFFFNVSRTGKAIRACADNPFGARSVGLNLERLQAVTFGLGTAVTGAAGALLAQGFELRPALVPDFTATGLTIVLIGGLGNIGGALLGGLLVGVSEALAGTLLQPSLKGLFSYGLLLAVLLLRPRGLLGEER